MRALIASEHHFARRPDGRIYADGPPNYNFWSRYVEIFEEVLVLARVGDSANGSGAQERADGEGVQFVALPDYRGPWQYLSRLPSLRARVRECVRVCDAFILRVPGLVGRLVSFELHRQNKPYALEVVGDPWEAFGTGTWRSVMRPLFRQVAARNMRALCRDAAAARYVTQRVLQQRYPAGPRTLVSCFSDVELQQGFANAEQREARVKNLRARLNAAPDPARPLGHVGFIGSFSQMYKAPDVLLRALAQAVGEGLNLQASFAGDGHHRAEMEHLCRKLGLQSRVRFLGNLSYGRSVQLFFDSIDLLVVPSRTEGLPRALLEAMARGCPCIGSRVGGIPELLDDDNLFAPNDVAALTMKMTDVLQDPLRMARMSLRNYEKALEFCPDVLDARRREFYCAVRDVATRYSRIAR